MFKLPFLILLVAVQLATYLLHKGYFLLINLDQTLSPNLLTSYLIHSIVITLVYFSLEYSIRKKSQFILLIYFGFIIVKLVLYFLYYKPLFMQDDEVFLWEFMTFLIPLLICLGLFIGKLSFNASKNS